MNRNSFLAATASLPLFILLAGCAPMHDTQLDALIDNAIQHSPDMQVAEQRIQLAEAQAKAVEAQDGPQLDFSADIERQRMSAEGLMGPFWIYGGKTALKLLRGSGRSKRAKRSRSRPDNCWQAAWRDSTGSGKHRQR